MHISRKVLLVLGLVACSGETSKGSAAPPSREAVVAAIQASDDFEPHRDSLVRATTDLVAAGRCTLAELKDLGGWVKSQNEKSSPVYFVNCGGMKVSDKIYLDAATGKLR